MKKKENKKRIKKKKEKKIEKEEKELENCSSKEESKILVPQAF